ncbi:MAG: alkaline phosphatase family protein [Chthoniobacterales bacterium]
MKFSFLKNALAILLCLFVFHSLSFAAETPKGKASHIVIIVWDGLRPDMVTAKNTPTLYKFSQEGTFFTHHHAVYPSTTEVNGTALATGMYPEHSGIIGNREFRPLIAPNEPSGMEKLSTIRKGESVMQGNYLKALTLYEILQAKGIPTVVAGTKSVALLADRNAKPSEGSYIVYEGSAFPAEILPKLNTKFGVFSPTPTYPDKEQNTWTTRVLLEELWKNDVPKLSLLWLSDPDYSQHHSQPGSVEALAALKANDDLLGKLLATLDAKGIREKTDILLVSDHGFSTTEQVVDFSTLLIDAGFKARRKFLAKPTAGDILVVSNGASTFFYVTDRNKETTHKLVDFLQHCKCSGVILSKEVFPGTFTLKTALLDTPDAPDVIVSMPWNDRANASGVKGLLYSDSGTPRDPGYGTHGSLSRYDMHNTLIAAGPDFRKSFKDELPSGNTDLAPTVLWILGIDAPKKMDGRVLTEALINSHSSTLHSEEKTLEANGKNLPWHQYLKTSTVGSTLYFDEGNGGQTK